jgi:hypothetical protein
MIDMVVEQVIETMLLFSPYLEDAHQHDFAWSLHFVAASRSPLQRERRRCSLAFFQGSAVSQCALRIGLERHYVV